MRKFANKCRTCLNGSNVLHPLTGMATDVRHSPKSYGEILKELSNINIMEKKFKDLPQSICSCCIRKLKSSYAFVQQVRQINGKLLSMVDDESDCLEESQIDIEKCLEVKAGIVETEYRYEEITFEDILQIKEPDEDNSQNTTKGTTSLVHNRFSNDIKIKIKSDNEDSDDMFDTDHDDKSIISENSEQEDNKSEIDKKVAIKIKPINTNEDLLISCDQCDKVFPNAEFLHHHQRFTHISNELKVQCPYCPAKYSRRYGMYAHLKSHHQNEAIEKHIVLKREYKKRSKKYACEQCTNSYIRKSRLKRHIKERHSTESTLKEIIPKKDLLCTLCGSKFNTQSSLNLHIRRHTGDKAHKCDLCERSFYRRYELQIHRRSHTGEKPFQCSICQKAFDRSFRLKTHMISHSNERPFKCTECEKDFKQSKHLRVHERTHM